MIGTSYGTLESAGISLAAINPRASAAAAAAAAMLPATIPATRARRPYLLPAMSMGNCDQCVRAHARNRPIGVPRAGRFLGRISYTPPASIGGNAFAGYMPRYMAVAVAIAAALPPSTFRARRRRATRRFPIVAKCTKRFSAVALTTNMYTKKEHGSMGQLPRRSPCRFLLPQPQ